MLHLTVWLAQRQPSGRHGFSRQFHSAAKFARRENVEKEWHVRLFRMPIGASSGQVTRKQQGSQIIPLIVIIV
jgi:hypothetical protein